MAQVTPKLEILAEVSRPADEISGIISAFIRFHPGKEIEILRTVRESIDEAIRHFDTKEAE